MARVEILLATMHADNRFLVEKMNVQSPIIVASQEDQWGVDELCIDKVNCRVFRTITRGVGINRNIALAMAREDILLFADDDVTYSDGYEQKIIDAFLTHPQCDVMIFRMKFEKNGKVYEEDRFQTKRIHIFNGLSFGTYQIAVRRKSALRVNVHFTHLFGGGCPYSCGEDSLFLIDCFRKGLKVYTYDYLLGTNRKDTSSWYSGMNEKFFYDKGVFLSVAFPKMKYLLTVYYAIRLKSEKDCDLGFIRKIGIMKQGIDNGSSLITFKEYMEYNG